MGKNIAQGIQLDVSDKADLSGFLNGIDSFLSAVPYWFPSMISEVATQAKVHMCDLGGNTDLVSEQMKLDEVAGESGAVIMNAKGYTLRGSKMVEIGVPASLTFQEIKRRGFNVSERLEFLD